jgi:hypothetical protein
LNLRRPGWEPHCLLGIGADTNFHCDHLLLMQDSFEEPPRRRRRSTSLGNFVNGLLGIQ